MADPPIARWPKAISVPARPCFEDRGNGNGRIFGLGNSGDPFSRRRKSKSDSASRPLSDLNGGGSHCVERAPYSDRPICFSSGVRSGAMGESQRSESQEAFGKREERIAYNEAWHRSLNEHKAEWMDRGLTTAGFRCECGNRTLSLIHI